VAGRVFEPVAGVVGDGVELDVADGFGVEHDEAAADRFFREDAGAVLREDTLVGPGVVAAVDPFEHAVVGEPAGEQAVLGLFVAHVAEGQVAVTCDRTARDPHERRVSSVACHHGPVP